MSAPLAARADIMSRMQSSIQLQTNSADGNVGGLGTLTDGVGQGSVSTATQTSAGGAYTFSQSFIEGDAIVTTAPSLGAVSAYSDQTSTAVGTGTGTGTVTSAHAVTACADVTVPVPVPLPTAVDV